ncbi:wd-40 repeat protein [Stylonychia lemnae]|uniref:Wd-40 repeat protein n=1 Tax=Stylonychia lemnae TaxID=5949 RepID=A0A078A129_STYLE|nr:wd-40 repeat protein [Stylonychia lemnae]|eukprot:CDW75557.1 wd-40 repeat protein [Stylonychia lemnae]
MKVANSGSFISEKKYYSKKYLNDECNSREFLNSISYTVALNELLQIRKTLCYQEKAPYTPVMFEIMVQRLKDYYRGNFLLQLWSIEGKKHYEKVFKFDIVSWNIQRDYLIFMQDPREEPQQWIYIVCFKKEFSVIKVKNFVTDPSFTYIGISQQLLHLANQRTIKIVDVQRDFGSEKEIKIEPKSDQIVTFEITGGCKLHGFFENRFSCDDTYIMCYIETLDNQIDYSRLYNWERSNIVNPAVEFYQYREVVKRDLSGDPIQKITQIIKSDDFQYGLALRSSGKVDIYWNYTLTQTPDDSNFTSLFMKQNKQDGMKMISLDVKWDSRIGVDIANESSYTDKLWAKISEQQIKQYLKLYGAFTLINTTFLVAYNNIVSTFDVIKKLWLDHYIQDETIVDLLRNQRDATSDDYIVGVLLQSGKIVPLESTNIDGINIWKQSDVGILNVGKGIKKIVSDWRDISSHYIQTENDGNVKVMGYQNCTIRELTGDVKVEPYEYMARFLSLDPTEDIAMLNTYEGKIRVFKNETNHANECKVTPSIEIKIEAAYQIQKRVHTIVLNKAREFLFLFDEENVYIVNRKDGQMTVVKDMNITSLQLIDGNFIYSMTNDCPTKNLTSGFYFYDLNQLIEKAEESFNFKLKGALVGHNNLIDYYRQDERIAYMTDYEEIKIVPILHRNTINLFVMQKRKNYVGYSRVKDKLIALDKNNVLTTWNITTGKVVGQTKLKSQVVSPEYKIFKCDESDIIYQSGWYQPYVLLINLSEVVQNVDEKAFFGDRFYTSLPNNTTVSSVEPKDFRSFKIIQIVSETEVAEKMTFVHPQYKYGSYQRIYFSEDLQYMLERLDNQRVLLYKQIQTGTPGLVSWSLIRRLKQFPMDLAQTTYANYLFSPDLQYYLDFDKSENVFLIRRSLDQTTKCQIPKGIMNPQTEEPIKIGKRFRWVNSNVIKIINSEGIEKIINIENGFKDINQDTVPMIELKDFENENYHYYFEPVNIPVQDTEKRLIRKFQAYNSAVYLDQIVDKEQLYETIFQVDFTSDNYRERVVVDMSFTFIHWKLAELLANPLLKLKLKRFGLQDIRQTTLNIFPKGNTVLHYSYKQLNNIRKLFDIISTYNDTLEEGAVKHEIPFIQNFKGVSPLHLCIYDNNYKSAEIFLQKLSNTPLDSHSRAIVDILHKFVENGIPSLGSYLDNRMIQTQQLINRGQRRGAILYKDDLEYAVSSCELWPDIDNVDKLLFSNDPRESEVKLEFLDMPKIHSYNEVSGDEFFKALADSNDIELFSYRSIQSVIDYKWPLAREYTIKVLFIPFIFYQLTFLIYSNVFCGQFQFGEDKYSDSWWIGHNVLAALLYLFSIYFLSNEIRQFYVTGIDYLSSVWNYSDILPPILIIVVVSLKLNTYYNEDYEPNNFIYTVHSVATLLMWIKLLYFLRIFRSTGYLVRTLTDVIYDMKVFLLILFIVYFGFGEAFLRLSEKSDPEMQFIQNYAYCWVYAFRLSIGDNATDTFDDTIQPVTLWIIWVIAGILTNIVMLNLLISIISESFAKINEKSKEANYQERARIISENGYLIPRYIKNSQDDFDKYIIVANEVIDTQDEEKNALKTQVKALDDKINEFKDQMTKQQDSLEAKLNSLLE